MRQKKIKFKFPKDVTGWCSVKEGRLLYQLAQVNPKQGSVVELGSFHGRSTICLAQGSKQVNGGKVFTVDTFVGDRTIGIRPSYYPQFKQNIKRYKFDNYISAFCSDTVRVAKNWSRPIRLLFIDAGHFYEEVFEDYHSWERYVVPNGIIAFHDSEWPGVHKFICQLLKSGKIKDFMILREKQGFGVLTYGRKPTANESVFLFQRYYSWLKFQLAVLPAFWNSFKRDIYERGMKNQSDPWFRFFGTIAYYSRMIKTRVASIPWTSTRGKPKSG